MSKRSNIEALIVNPEANQDEIDNAISDKLAHAESMAFALSDDDFRQWNNEIQGNYYWALQRMIGEIRMLHAHAAKVPPEVQS